VDLGTWSFRLGTTGRTSDGQIVYKLCEARKVRGKRGHIQRSSPH
jgi:hypothetical protein